MLHDTNVMEAKVGCCCCIHCCWIRSPGGGSLAGRDDGACSSDGWKARPTCTFQVGREVLDFLDRNLTRDADDFALWWAAWHCSTSRPPPAGRRLAGAGGVLLRLCLACARVLCCISCVSC